MNWISAAPANSVGPGNDQENVSTLHSPIEALDYGTTGQLFDEIRTLLSQIPGLATDCVLKLAYFVLAIQFPECAEIWPFVSIVTPDPVGSSLLLRTLASLSASPLHVGEISLNALLSLPASPRPTLVLIDQLASSKELERVLRIMSRPGGLYLRNGKFYDLFFPTVVCTSEPLHDRWILDQAVHVAFNPTRNRLPKLEPKSVRDSARKLQGKLLRYREVNLAAVRESHFDAP